MTARKKNVKDLNVALSEIGSIDSLIDNDDSFLLNYTSPSNGKTIALQPFRFSGDDILSKTKVHTKNKRKQQYLTRLSLAPLIKSLIKNNQVSPALARIEDDGSLTIIFGSRRRMGTHFAEKEFVVLASKDLTDDIAEEISDAENVSEDISLIERGHLWLDVQTNEGLSSRAISTEFEDSKVSHTVIAAGILGAKLPIEIVKLYPSTNTIGRQTISKLSAASEIKSTNEIVDYVTDNHSETITNLWDAHSENDFANTKLLTTKLTNIIAEFCLPTKTNKAQKTLKTNTKLAEGVNAKLSKSGAIEYITFDKNTSQETILKVKEFFGSL
jgi:ParB/RepB/Spo0J family partition protein